MSSTTRMSWTIGTAIAKKKELKLLGIDMFSLCFLFALNI